ncbi:ParB/RepB/Spo0J family partition protein [Sneathiella chungangensis]|uniref:ParB/RepB/Spo0J family partition protein n=1 Tax=Sneathiella chungangensis TaxID=1418234 RepID=A0A845MLR6_9PROT|nr:ParB/RepB/Spo0J family partition protein [Sneathiella chungangensis]MZR24076.1 ParB/RepB/Spo0J family partition protein [Sneathiella chungangensis]
MTDDNSKKKLGRGLSALLGDDMAADYADLDKVRSTKEVPVEQMRANQFQPRLDWDQEALDSLAASIAEKGVLQPILVRRKPTADSEYEIIAGERRWRAAQIARLHQVPVIIKELTDAETMEIALIENIQREDLSPIEEAEAYKRLMGEFDHTQESLALHVGKSRAHVANMMRLLTLPASVQKMVREGSLAAGAARTLINHEWAEEVAKKIVAQGLSVRGAEKLAKKIAEERRPDGEGKPGKMARKFQRMDAKGADVLALESDLTAAVGMDVSIDHQPDGHGRITIRYTTLDQLDDACRRLTREPLHMIREEYEEDPLDEDFDPHEEFADAEIYEPEPYTGGPEVVLHDPPLREENIFMTKKETAEEEEAADDAEPDETAAEAADEPAEADEPGTAEATDDTPAKAKKDADADDAEDEEDYNYDDEIKGALGDALKD